MKIACRLTFKRLRTTLVILGIGLLITACGGGGGGKAAGPGEDPTPPPSDDAPMVTELGAWNTLTAGALDISDANNVLRAYYDTSGNGQLTAPAPVQPTGMGTATWTGMWSGKIDVNPNPASDTGLALLGLTRADLQTLGGGASVTAYFESSGVEAEVTFEDIGLESLGLTQIGSGRASVTGGRFQLETTHTSQVPLGQGQLTVTGQIAGEGAFGGTDATGVAGHMGGDVSISYGRGPVDLGNFKSVFYGTKDAN